MSRVRLYIDEDAMRGSLVRGLKLRGIDTVSALESRLIGRPDESHLAFATSAGRVLYSFNVADFRRIHLEWMAAGRTHAGIILTQQRRYSIGDQIGRIVHLIGSLTAEEMRDREEFLNRW